MVEALDHAPEDLTVAERLVLIAFAERARDDTRVVLSRDVESARATVRRRTGLSESGLRKVLGRLASRGLDLRVPLGTSKNGRPIYSHEGRSVDYRIPVLSADLLGSPLDDESRPERVTTDPGEPTREGHHSAVSGETTGTPRGTRGSPLEPERWDDRVTPSLSPSDIPDAREAQLSAGAEQVLRMLGSCDDARAIAETILDKHSPDDLARYIARIPVDDLRRRSWASKPKPGRKGRPAGPRCPAGYPFDPDGECACGDGHRLQQEAS